MQKGSAMTPTITDPPPVVTRARYAKGMMLVRCPSVDGFKSRASYLASALRGRWTNRERGYVMSPSKAARLVQLYEAGWDATLTGKLIEPKVSPRRDNPAGLPTKLRAGRSARHDRLRRLLEPKVSTRRDNPASAFNDRMLDIGYKHHGGAFLDYLAGTDEPEEP